MKTCRDRASVREFRRAGSLCLLSFWISACGGLLPAADGLAHDRPRVEPGIEYLHHRIGDGPSSIHVAKVDRSVARFQLVSTLAQDRVYGLASVSEQVAAFRSARVRPVAAVNGDFFVIRTGPYQGDPLGLHIVQGELISSPTGTSFWIDGKSQPHIGQVAARFRATGPNGFDITFGLNQDRGDDAAVLYTPTVGSSTRTGAGLELILERYGDGDWLPLRAGVSYHGRVVTLAEQGNIELAPGTMVLSIGPILAQKLATPAPGDVISLDLATLPDLTGATVAVGGGPILLDVGKSPEWSEPQPKHPRTALGWNDEQFFLVVVDGRQRDLSAGMTYPELASLMKRLGCEYAVNLDGGGSSTFWLDGHIMNSPSDGRERAVANSLIVVSVEPNETGEAMLNR
ncbi:MAG: phosphodiester glycosidase family protein [Phycisphaerales bacterium]